MTEYQYDKRGYLSSVTEPDGDTVSYTYDTYGNRASMTYPDGETVKYTYDELNRLVKLSGLGESVRYGYNAKGQRTETRTDKLTTEYAYDAAGNLVSQSTTGAYDLAFEYDYDKAGRITQESRTENGVTLTSEYAYDKLGQLTSFERSDGYTESYVYDPVGNMLSKTRNGVKTEYTYNAANQLVSDGENKYTYDKNGNLVQKGSTKYTYNAQDLLESWTDGEHSESYSYNANRLLSSVTNDEGTTSFAWDILTGDGVVISAESGGDTTDYLYGLERIAALNGKNKTEYAYDGRGSVAAELRYTDAWYTLGGALSKADVTSKSYTPFGEQIGEALSGFAYNGEYYNANTGMIYLRARFYEPEMNRFSQKDILWGDITVPNSLNSYAYVQNDPLNLIDPSGESLKSAWNSAKTAVKNAWTTAKTAVSNAAKSVKNWATNTWNKLTNKTSAPAVTPPAPTQQRNTLPSGRQTQRSGSSKNAGKTDYSTAGVTQATSDQVNRTNNTTPYAMANAKPEVGSVCPEQEYYCGTSNKISDIHALFEEDLDALAISVSEKYNKIKDMVLKTGRVLVKSARESAIQAENKKQPGTLVIGINLSLAYGLGGGVNAGIGFDNNGNIGFVDGGSLGASLPSASAMAFISTSNAPDLNALKDISLVTGASGGEVIVVGGELGLFRAGENGEYNNYVSGTVMAGIGVGTPIEIHQEVARSYVVSFNIYELIISVADWILSE